SAQRSVLIDAMDTFIKTSRGQSGQFKLRGQQLQNGPTAQLCVIIPVYKDAIATLTCIESVLHHRDAELHRVVLVNDCSPDEDMAALLGSYRENKNLFILTNETNLGFVKSANRAMSFCEPHDVLLLNSDTVIFNGALDELWRVAYSAADVG